MVDFTECERNPYRVYGGGNGNKISITYQGDNYMLKFPPKKSDKKILYTNGCISEYIACHIYNIVGIDVQKTIYGQFMIGDKQKGVVACKDFNEDGYTLEEFAKVKNGCIDSLEDDSNGYGTELDSILEAIETQSLVSAKKLNEHFWNMFIMDAYLGNFDRHNGNWGILVNNEEQTAKIAPVYDCGSCLYPQITEKDMAKVLDSQDEIDNRIFVFPTSAVKQNNKKINYFDFISSNVNQDCTEVLYRIYPAINSKEVHKFIMECDFLSEIQKEFYTTMLEQRLTKILQHSFNKLLAFEKEYVVNSHLKNKYEKMGQELFGWDDNFVGVRLKEIKKNNHVTLLKKFNQNSR